MFSSLRCLGGGFELAIDCLIFGFERSFEVGCLRLPPKEVLGDAILSETKKGVQIFIQNGQTLNTRQVVSIDC